MASSDGSLSFLLIGAGRVGTAVSALLKESGAVLAGVSSRSDESSENAALRLGAETFDYRTELPEADLLLLGAGEDGIAQIASTIAKRATPGTAACHFAGAFGIGPLEPLGSRGLGTLALHPVQACPDVDSAVLRLPGSVWGVTCRDENLARATDFVARVRGRPVRVAEDDRPVWHAAAVTVSNGIAALMAVGEAMLGSIGVDDPATVLGPLASGTVDNARAGGGGGATLTGPVVRNETRALLRHVEALGRVGGGLADEYVAVASSIIRAAVRAGRLDEEAAARMLAALVPP